MHDLIPRPRTRTLDVGCNDGGFGRWLLATGISSEVWGIEVSPTQADAAREHLTGVVTGSFPEALDQLEGEFDCVTFNHVLEHMIDPWGALALTRRRLGSGGCVVALIPNIRYVTVVANLAVRGRWEYQETGLLDKTHLRFFTRRSVAELFDGAGLRIDTLRPVNGIGSVRFPVLSRLAARVAGDLAYGGFAVRAFR